MKVSLRNVICTFVITVFWITEQVNHNVTGLHEHFCVIYDTCKEILTCRAATFLDVSSLRVVEQSNAHVSYVYIGKRQLLTDTICECTCHGTGTPMSPQSFGRQTGQAHVT